MPTHESTHISTRVPTCITLHTSTHTHQRICLYTGTASAKEIKTLQAALVDADKEWAQALDAKEREVAKLRAELSLQTAAAANTATVMLEGGQKGKASEANDPGDAQTVAALQEVAALKAALTDAKELAREQRALLAKQLANDRELGLVCQQIVASAPATTQADEGKGLQPQLSVATSTNPLISALFDTQTTPGVSKGGQVPSDQVGHQYLACLVMYAPQTLDVCIMSRARVLHVHAA